MTVEMTTVESFARPFGASGTQVHLGGAFEAENLGGKFKKCLELDTAMEAAAEMISDKQAECETLGEFGAPVMDCLASLLALDQMYSTLSRQYYELGCGQFKNVFAGGQPASPPRGPYFPPGAD